MSSFTNNINPGTSSGQGDHSRRSGHYASMTRQQNAPPCHNLPLGEHHWTSEPHRRSHLPPDFASSSNATLWLTAPFPDASLSVCGVGTWPGNQPLRLGASFSTPRGNIDGLGMSPAETEVATPALEQAFPAPTRALPALQSSPPLPSWTHVLDPRQSSSPWDRPAYTARQHNNRSNPMGPLATRPLQFATSSAITSTGQSERMSVPIGPPPTTPISVQAWVYGDPAPIASSISRPLGERWSFSNGPTFQCQWTSRCTALVTGYRRSVTNHLRDAHDFACDGQTIQCTWDGCTAHMQRRNIPRHIIACHFAIKVPCSSCGLALSRADASKKHRLACPGARTPEVVEGTEEDKGRLL